MAFDAIFKKSTTLQDVNPDPEMGEGVQLTPMNEAVHIVPVSSGNSTPMGHTLKKVQLVRNEHIQ